MAVGAQLVVAGEARERLALEHAVAVQVAEHARLEAEEAAVDPVRAARLLDEAGDGVAVELGNPPLDVRPHDRNRGEGAVATVEIELGAEIDIGHAVRVGNAEAL